MTSLRIPPIQCLVTFETLARLRSVTQTADELCVTPSAVSHRVKQLEQMLGVRLFGLSGRLSHLGQLADGHAFAREEDESHRGPL